MDRFKLVQAGVVCCRREDEDKLKAHQASIELTRRERVGVTRQNMLKRVLLYEQQHLYAADTTKQYTGPIVRPSDPVSPPGTIVTGLSRHLHQRPDQTIDPQPFCAMETNVSRAVQKHWLFVQASSSQLHARSLLRKKGDDASVYPSHEKRGSLGSGVPEHRGAVSHQDQNTSSSSKSSRALFVRFLVGVTAGTKCRAS